MLFTQCELIFNNIKLTYLIAQGQDRFLGFETSLFFNLQHKTFLGNFSDQDLRISNMRVKYACQVMSHTVAVGFETLISLETLNTTAQGTVDFINSMDKLFNLFNSRSSVSEQPEVYLVKPLNSIFPFKNLSFQN